jgi:AcrR family transcriptional regulator
MAEKGYEAVTIQDIIDRADIGRSTFHNHYTNKDDLLTDGFADLRTLVGRPANGSTASHRGPLCFSLPFLRHLQEQQNLARVVFTEGSMRPVLKRIEELLLDVVRSDLPPTTGRGVPPEALARFVVAAHVGLVAWWLGQSPRSTPEEVDEIFRALTQPAIDAPG